MSSPTYVFGPVPSRRLGRSLGVDLIPMKTCPLDCVYCQLGRTTNRTIERKVHVPVEDVVAQVRDTIRHGARPDVITLSGSGEPTLHAAFGDVLDGIRSFTDTRRVLLTNGTLFTDPDVRRAAAKADLVIPSLDAADEAGFQAVNRPHPDLRFEGLVDGLAAFRKEFSGELWLEVFLLEGVTGDEDTVRRMLPHIERIRPDHIQINTAVRPPADADARPVPEARLHRLAEILGPKAEVIARFHAAEREADFRARKDDVLAFLRRRPGSVEDIAGGLGIHRNEAVKYIDELQRDDAIQSESRGGITYYMARPS